MRKNPEPFEHSQTPIGKITEITDGLEGLEVAGEFYPHLLGRMTISKEDLFTDRPNMLNVIRDEMEKNYLESLKKRKEE